MVQGPQTGLQMTYFSSLFVALLERSVVSCHSYYCFKRVYSSAAPDWLSHICSAVIQMFRLISAHKPNLFNVVLKEIIL